MKKYIVGALLALLVAFVMPRTSVPMSSGDHVTLLGLDKKPIEMVFETTIMPQIGAAPIIRPGGYLVAGAVLRLTQQYDIHGGMSLPAGTRAMVEFVSPDNGGSERDHNSSWLNRFRRVLKSKFGVQKIQTTFVSFVTPEGLQLKPSLTFP